MNKLSNRLHKAVQQLNSVNENHIVANVILWVTDNMQLNHKNFVEFMDGRIRGANGAVIRDYRNYDFFKRNKNDWTKIDLHIWLDIRNLLIIQRFLFINSDYDLLNSDIINRIEISLLPQP